MSRLRMIGDIPPLPLYAFTACTWRNVKVKVKFALEQAMKAQRGSRGIALPFL
jgi:hypothetical protein